MSVYSTEYHAMVMSPGRAGTESVTVTANKAAGETAPTASGPKESFFHHLLDVVNPLQHLPVIGTIYRAMTGEHIGTVEKIAGDTLYGGMWGAVASVADVAFEGITGKNFEDTIMGLFKGGHTTGVASTKVRAPVIAADAGVPSADLPTLPSFDEVATKNPTSLSSGLASGAPAGLDVAAFTSALSAKGVDGDTANRALYAYRRSLGFPMTQPVLAGVH